MPYMKQSAAPKVGKGAKAAIAVVLVLAVLTVAALVFWAKNPRGALQLLLSDQDYASYVLVKNIKSGAEQNRVYLDRLGGNSAYEGTGNVSVELSKDMQDLVGSEDVLKTAQRYMDRLSFTTDTQVRALHFSNQTELADNKQTILTHNLAFLPSGLYSEVPEYGYGWSKLLGGESGGTKESNENQQVLSSVLSSGDQDIQKSITKAGKKAYKAVKKDIAVTKDDDITFDFQDKHVTGQRINILLGKKEVSTFIQVFTETLQQEKNLRSAVNALLDTEDTFGSDESFNAYLQELSESLQKTVKDTGVSRLSIDLCVDKNNVIHAFDALVKRAEGDLILNAMVRDDKDRGPALHLRSGGDTVVKVNVEKKSKTAGTVSYGFGDFENTLTYSDLSFANGFVYGTFEFAPTKVNWSEDLGTFGLYLKLTPAVKNGAPGFRLNAQTGFSTIGTATIEAEVADGKYTGMLTEEDLQPKAQFSTEQKRARRVQYWLTELPAADSQYNNALSSIVRDILNDLSYAATASAVVAGNTEDELLNAGA